MKPLTAFWLVFLVAGIDSTLVEDVEGQLILKASSLVEDFLAPLNTVQKDVRDISGRMKSHFATRGLSIASADDCLALTNTTQIAYNLAVNATSFAVASVKEVTSALNVVVNCPNEHVLPTEIIKCAFDQLKVVQQDVLDIEADFAPYQTQAGQLYAQMISEIHACIGF